VTVVAGDDAEGYNPTHDVCRMVVDAAVALARCSQPEPIANLAFMLMDRPGHVGPGHATRVQVALDAAALERKIAAALRYPEMAGEVAYARKTWGDDAFRIEAFRRVSTGELWAPGDAPPFYEQYGRQQVEAGKYAEVIRYDEHIRPLASALTARALRQAS